MRYDFGSRAVENPPNNDFRPQTAAMLTQTALRRSRAENRTFNSNDWPADTVTLTGVNESESDALHGAISSSTVRVSVRASKRLSFCWAVTLALFSTNPGHNTSCAYFFIAFHLWVYHHLTLLPPSYSSLSVSVSVSLSLSVCCSCIFITITRGSDIFYLFVYCLSCLNINRFLFYFIFKYIFYNCFSMFHLFSSLARTRC